MRNLRIVRDHRVNTLGDSAIVSVASDPLNDCFYSLTENGMLYSYFEGDQYAPMSPEPTRLMDELRNALLADGEELPAHDEWFYMTYLQELGVLTLFTREGFICSLGSEGGALELVGGIEGGLAAAAWSPDQSLLALVTNNDTIMTMTLTWEVVLEVDISKRQVGSPVALSWSGDGQMLALYTQDEGSTEGAGNVRIFSRDLELQATARGLQNGPAGELTDLRPATISFAVGGNLVAIAQAASARGSRPPRVIFVERNGLQHGSLDVRVPQRLMAQTATDDSGESKPTEITALHWNADSNLLVIGLRGQGMCVVQAYYRDNYYWYLKGEWEEPQAACLGFDMERNGRLYISSTPTGSSGSSSCVRVMDLIFETMTSGTRDASVAVVDGTMMNLTPLGRACMPPPMSMHKLGSTREARPGSDCIAHASFFSLPSELSRSRSASAGNSLAWGLASLSSSVGDYSAVNVTIWLADTRGTVQHTSFMSVALPTDYHPETLRARLVYVTTEAMATEAGESMLRLHVLLVLNDGRRGVDGRAGPDCVGLVHTDMTMTSDNAVEHLQLRMIHRVSAAAHRITAVAALPEEDTKVFILGVVGQDDMSSPFQLYLLRWKGEEDQMNPVGTDDVSYNLCMDLPEPLESFMVLSMGEGESGDEEPTVVGLSGRNRLYCNDTLLLAGASSFALNAPLDTLLYTSMGTRPHLHMASIAALLQHIHQGEGQDVELRSAIDEKSRPVERGGRLVCCSSSTARCVLQMPRGNLEAFEPRTLVLALARRLLDQRPPAFFDCLVMLRRQKVDLNFLIDHDPSCFLENFTSLAEAALPDRSDLLCLLLSSMGPADTSRDKYPHPASLMRKCLDWGVSTPFEGDVKVNAVCQRAREVLLPIYSREVAAGNDGDHAKNKKHPTAFLPLLCTYACEAPAALEGGLSLVRRAAADERLALERSAWASAGLKYLSFLATHQALFDSALAVGDFPMARVVARQYQMDPKVYLPLLSGFERYAGGDMGANVAESELNAAQCTARFHVHAHLKRWSKATTWGVRARLRGADTPSVRDVIALVSKHALFSGVTEVIVAERKLSNEGAQEELQQALHIAYGHFCTERGFYDEAISAFLSCPTPQPTFALDAAEAAQDWERSVLISSRYFTASADRGPKATVRRLVDGFRGVLATFPEQLSEEDLVPVPAFCTATAGGDTVSTDRPLEAAALCLDYLEDAEAAVSVLLASKRYLAAARAALRANRLDLLEEDVSESTVRGAEVLAVLLVERVERQRELNAELGELWAEPEERVRLIRESDPGVGELERKQQKQHEQDDAGSDLSYASRASQQSYRSGMTSVSVLSNMSLSSTASGTSAASKKSEFSVQGIAHDLLSRGKQHPDGGTGAATGSNGQQETNKERKRRQRLARQHGGRGKAHRRRDPMGLRREEEACKVLWEMSCSLPVIAAMATDLSDTLLLLGGATRVAVAARLQAALKVFTKDTQAAPAPVAPRYPSEWLSFFQMPTVVRYQNKNEGNDETAAAAAAVARAETCSDGASPAPQTTPDNETWWEKTAAGLKIIAESGRLLPVG